MNAPLTLFQHATAVASILFISLNLAFWSPFFLLLLPFKLLGSARVRLTVNRLLHGIYRSGVQANDWWFKRILRIGWSTPIDYKTPLKPCVVLCNHTSWSDGFIAQSIMAQAGYSIVALSKQRLAYIPLLGLLFLLYDFPLLKRHSKTNPSVPHNHLNSNVDRIRQTCLRLLNTPAAILNFAEGTRITAQKHVEANSPYQHLLAPRIGGFSILCTALKDTDTSIVDITLSYPESDKFWRFLSGTVKRIHVDIQQLPLPDPDTTDLEQWLAQCWQRKDALLAQHLKNQ